MRLVRWTLLSWGEVVSSGQESRSLSSSPSPGPSTPSTPLVVELTLSDCCISHSWLATSQHKIGFQSQTTPPSSLLLWLVEAPEPEPIGGGGVRGRRRYLLSVGPGECAGVDINLSLDWVLTHFSADYSDLIGGEEGRVVWNIGLIITISSAVNTNKSDEQHALVIIKTLRGSEYPSVLSKYTLNLSAFDSTSQGVSYIMVWKRVNRYSGLPIITLYWGIYESSYLCQTDIKSVTERERNIDKL